MSNKTTFKRIALALVAAVGFGVLASTPSNGAIVAHALALATDQASSGTATVGEAVTINVRQTITGLSAGDSATTLAVLTKPTTSAASGTLAFRLADSSNATVANAVASGFTPTSNAAAAYAGYTYSITPDVAGTYTIVFYGVGEDGTNPAPVTYTLTASAKNVSASATFSKAALTGGANGQFNGTVISVFTADSTVVVAKGDTAVARLSFDLRNSADTNVVTGTSVNESITAVITGPGLLSLNGSTTAKLRAVTTVNSSDTIVVWGDNTAGKTTVTLTSTSMKTWTTKSLTFSDAASKATLTAAKSVTSNVASDSATALRVAISDSGDNLVTTAQTMYVHSSDTKVVNNGACTVTVSASLGYGTCSLSGLIVDSGTTKIKVANFAFGTAAASLPTTQIVTNEVDFRISGAPAKVAIKFDKTTYRPGEEAGIVITVTDGAGNTVADQAIQGLFTAGISLSPAGSAVSGFTLSDTVVTLAGLTNGVGKYITKVYMPTVGGDVVASATGGLGLALAANRVVVSDTVTVVDPAEDAANSALDAAQEATDAAIAATDAAILAQEAADEAASAAVAAQETAQAAVDAVTALSAEVTKLVAQLATLQKLLNRVAKRVGVKL